MSRGIEESEKNKIKQAKKYIHIKAKPQTQQRNSSAKGAPSEDRLSEWALPDQLNQKSAKKTSRVGDPRRNEWRTHLENWLASLFSSTHFGETKQRR